MRVIKKYIYINIFKMSYFITANHQINFEVHQFGLILIHDGKVDILKEKINSSFYCIWYKNDINVVLSKNNITILNTVDNNIIYNGKYIKDN